MMMQSGRSDKMYKVGILFHVVKRKMIVMHLKEILMILLIYFRTQLTAGGRSTRAKVVTHSSRVLSLTFSEVLVVPLYWCCMMKSRTSFSKRSQN